MAGIMVRGQFSQLLADGINEYIVDWKEKKQQPLLYPEIFNVETSDRAYEQDVEMAGLPPLVQKDEGEAVTYEGAIQGGSIRYTHLEYALGTRITNRLIMDDITGILKQVPDAHLQSAHFVEEQVAWNVPNNGFTTLTTTDGLALFSNVHPLLGGASATAALPLPTASYTTAGTYPNRPATDFDLSWTGVKTMLNQFKRLINHRGLVVHMLPKLLIIPPEMDLQASEILGSAYKPGTANNDINALLKYGLTYFTCPYLTSTAAWFAFADKAQTKLKFFRRQPFETDYADDFDTSTVKMKSSVMFSAGASTWQGTWGTSGP